MRLRYLFLFLTITSIPLLGQIRVNVGGPAYTDSASNDWSADTGCTSTSTYSYPATIHGTTDPTLYKTGRTATSTLSCTYSVPTSQFYNVSLSFAEYNPQIRTGQRLMNIFINNVKYFTAFDVYAKCGFATACDIAPTPIPVINGALTIVITQQQGQPMLSALSILPVTTPSPSSVITYACATPVADNDDVACLRTALATSANVILAPRTYQCGSSLLGTAINVTAPSVYASGATFSGGCIFNNTSSMTWTSGYFDTSSISGTGGSSVWLVKASHTTFLDTRFNYVKNYTAIQVGTTGACPTDVILNGLTTTTTAESHVTVTCVDGMRVSNWLMDGGDESGFVLQPIAGPVQNVTAMNITANGVADIVQAAGGDYIMDNITLSGLVGRECLYLYEEQDFGTGTAPHTNVTLSNSSLIDTTGVLMDNFINITTSHVPHRNYIFSNLQGWGQFHTGAFSPGWIKISATSGTVPFSNFLFKDITFTTGGSGGTAPGYTMSLANDTNWTGFKISNVTTNASTGYGLQLNAAFATKADLIVENSHFSGLQSGSPTTAAHLINTSAVWNNNTTILNANQDELISLNAPTTPTGVLYATLIGNTQHVTPGTQQLCNDCQATTPPQSGGTGATCTRISSAAGWSCNPYSGTYTLTNYTANPVAVHVKMTTSQGATNPFDIIDTLGNALSYVDTSGRYTWSLLTGVTSRVFAAGGGTPLGGIGTSSNHPFSIFSNSAEVLRGNPDGTARLMQTVPSTCAGQPDGTIWLGGVCPSGIKTFNTRTGAISLTSGDVTSALTFTPANAASNTDSAVTGISVGCTGADSTHLVCTVTDPGHIHGQN